MSNSATSPITINFLFEDRQQTIDIPSTQHLNDIISNFIGREVFGVCYGENQMIIPSGNNLVAKRSTQNSSISSIFYFDEEIISTTEPILELKMKRISKYFKYFLFIYLFFYFYRF